MEEESGSHLPHEVERRITAEVERRIAAEVEADKLRESVLRKTGAVNELNEEVMLERLVASPLISPSTTGDATAEPDYGNGNTHGRREQA